jgi:hypothetical protein
MGGKGRSQSKGNSGTSQRKRWLMGAGAGTLLALPTLMVLGHSTAVQSALATALADPASILSARSPGSRADGALTQTKNKRPYAKAAPALRRGKPTERVLGQARTRPNVPVVPVGTADSLVAAPVAVPQGAFSDAVTTAGNPITGAAVVGGVPVFGVGVGGGTGGGGTGGGGNTGGGGDTPVTVVPEPSTWMMTILGFMTMGIGLRRRKAARRAVA